MPHDIYDNPLISRYASREMAALWGDQRKFAHLATAVGVARRGRGGAGAADHRGANRRAAGAVDTIDFDAADRYERKLRHDVMAHVHAYGDQCPQARPIIHLGATSCYVTDNTDLLLIRDALEMIAKALGGGDRGAGRFRPASTATCRRSASRICSRPSRRRSAAGPACGPTTWRSTWRRSSTALASLRARSVQGHDRHAGQLLASSSTATTQKVRQLEQLVAEKMGFDATYAVTGQTYSRKIDAQVLDALAGVAASAHKAATDLRLLANRKEIEEPFEADQIGSSAMAYKRNPMRCERMCGLARFAMSLAANADQTHATQWLERTLDDSANRRLVLPQAFLAVDAVLVLYHNVAAGLVVYPQVIARHLREELPFMATENILMAASRGRRRPPGRCTSGSANTARRPPPWSSNRAARTTCWRGSRATRPSPRSIWTRPSTPRLSPAAVPSRSTSSWPRSSNRSAAATAIRWQRRRKFACSRISQENCPPAVESACNSERIR